MRVRLQQNLWNGDSPVDISLPEDWNVQIVRMPCDDQPVLSLSLIHIGRSHKLEADNYHKRLVVGAASAALIPLCFHCR